MAWTRLSFSAIGWCSLQRVRAASRKSYRCGCLDPAASRVAPKSNCSNTFRSKFGKRWNGLLKQKDSRKTGRWKRLICFVALDLFRVNVQEEYASAQPYIKFVRQFW